MSVTPDLSFTISLNGEVYVNQTTVFADSHICSAQGAYVPSGYSGHIGLLSENVTFSEKSLFVSGTPVNGSNMRMTDSPTASRRQRRRWITL